MSESSIPAHVLAFLEDMKVPGVLSTLRADGSPITSAVWYAVLDGDVIISTPAGRPKARNARRDERVSFMVDTKEMPYRGVAIEGVAEVLDDPGAELMLTISRRYLGTDLPERIRERAAAGDRAIIRIRPLRVRPWNFAEPRP
ncbi:MAG: PPOX class F420-dependent oxidoreductase [Dehalococcoidia bacterium]